MDQPISFSEEVIDNLKTYDNRYRKTVLTSLVVFAISIVVLFVYIIKTGSEIRANQLRLVRCFTNSSSQLKAKDCVDNIK